MANEEQTKSAGGAVESPGGKGAAAAGEEKGPLAEAQENIAKVGEKVVAAMHTTADEAKAVVAQAQATARKASTAVAAKVQSARAEAKDAVSEVQARISKARKAVKAESGVAKRKVTRMRRAAVAEAKGVLAETEARVSKVTKALKGAVAKAFGKKAKAPAARLNKGLRKKTAATSRSVQQKVATAKKGAKKLGRKPRR